MIIDLIAGILISFGLYQGFTSGLIKTVFATISIIVAIVGALKLSPILIKFLQNNIDFNPAVLFVLGFVVTFILIIITIRYIGNKLERLFEKLNINAINKLAGAILLGLFYAILLSYSIHFMNSMSLISDNQKSKSFTYPVLKPLPAATQNVGRQLKPVFSEFWDVFINTLDEIKLRAEKK